MTSTSLKPLLEKAIASRVTLFDAPHESAFRLFNGFTEGYPDLVVDVYGSTVVFHNYADNPDEGILFVQEAKEILLNRLNWLHAGIVKTRNGKSQEEKRGELLFGTSVDKKISEHGIWYALNLTLNRDASFYLDTRNLRKWLIENMNGKSVLNTFAHTGSFGVAALAGGATRVVQVDHNHQFLDLAKKSNTLNDFSSNRNDFLAQDFFPAVSWLKQAKQLFDCVILDPPFFSNTSKGKVDLETDSVRLINKVRPLINDDGYLVAINNALYVSGQECMKTLEELCKDGYLKIRELISVPEDCTGYDRIGKPITDPAPFNHSTKIAVLDVKRKSG